ncbi:hypothetical protein GCM10022243_67550 [Saccharothrix violaceirubra]|uniref:Uncharacterized protein n=1 Tax=Saccharothrix violaceirubra TaxID=413306 RepID=A0A7W7T2D3_9PSEU|nr:hypothetical protein [Saccharothrix violaceirubra]MBB4965294.1 hypothetical protein [Saccharothrix violaceirubra]
MRRVLVVLLLVLAALTAPDASAVEEGYTVATASSSYVEGDTAFDLKGDNVKHYISLPFPVMYYGKVVRMADIVDDGYLAFGHTPDVLGPDSGPLPSTNAPNGAVYAFWDDLVIDDAAAIRTKVDGVEPARRFVVEWHNVRLKADGSRLSAEIVLHEGGQIVLQYKGIGSPTEAGARAVVGIEDWSGSSAVVWSNRQPKLSDATAVRFRKPGMMVARGVLRNANDRTPVSLADLKTVVNGRTVTMYTIWDGEYWFEVSTRGAVIEVTSADYPATSFEVPAGADNTVAARDILLPAPALVVESPPVEITVPAGQRRTATVTIRNNGALPGTWDAVREIEGGATAPQPDRPGAILRSWNPVASGVPHGYGIAELGGDVWISSRADRTLSRLTPDGVLLDTRPTADAIGDLAVIRDQGLLCYVVGGPAIRCIRPATGEVAYTVAGSGWSATTDGLAYLARTDMFFVSNARTIVQVKGSSHADAGTVVRQCGLSRYDQSLGIAGIGHVDTGSADGLVWIYPVSIGYGRVAHLSLVAPAGCGGRDLLPDPQPGGYTGAGLETDPAGNLWVFSNGPYEGPRVPKVSYIQSATPTYAELPWLAGGAPVVVGPGQSRAVEVTVDATSLRPGTYRATLELPTTAPKRPKLGIRVQVTVG